MVFIIGPHSMDWKKPLIPHKMIIKVKEVVNPKKMFIIADINNPAKTISLLEILSPIYPLINCPIAYIQKSDVPISPILVLLHLNVSCIEVKATETFTLQKYAKE
jgi:hypothetical protein